MSYVVGIIVIIVLISIYNKRQARKRREARIAYLMSKYNDEDIVTGIMMQRFWQGQTEEQLEDSLGEPEEKDHNVTRNKIKEVWKYDQTGKGRFGLRITLENRIVTGWNKKG